MIAKKENYCTLKIREGKLMGFESFSGLNLDLLELNQLISSSNEWEKDNQGLIIKYEPNDPVDKIFKKIALSHMGNNNFLDVSNKYNSLIEGTSCLIRKPEKHLILIALRGKSNKCSINRICISNEVREKFFNSCKQSNYYKSTGIYGIDTCDFEIYAEWSNFMNLKYKEETD